MTEEQWQTTDIPWEMLAFVRAKADMRLFRLFACACCRRAWALLPNEQSRRAVAVAEAYVDGAADEETRRAALKGANRVEELRAGDARMYAAEAAAALLRGNATYAAAKCAHCIARALAIVAWNDPTLAGDPYWDDEGDRNIAAERAMQAKIVREIFANPFRLVTIYPSWQTPDVTAIAQSIYQEHAFERMPILADALEDAGCDNADILNHCRQAGEHVHGCWVVDLIVAKERSLLPAEP
jgi:hypothetical protein